MKTITYEYEKMLKAGALLNSLVFSGIQQAKIAVEIANILDSGKEGEIIEKGEVEKQ